MRLLTPIVGLALLFGAGEAQALLIDEFDDASSATAGSGTPFDEDDVAIGAFFGELRTLQADWSFGPGESDIASDSSGNGLLEFGLDAGTEGRGGVGWTSFVPVDITEGLANNGLVFEVASSTSGVSITVTLFDDFGNGAEADFFVAADIDSLDFDISPVAAINVVLNDDFSSAPIDLAVDSISASFVPEPSMAALLRVTGLIAAGRLRPF